MRLRALLARLRPLSIGEITLTFFIALALMMIVFAGLAMRELSGLETRINQSEQKLARQELEEAMQLLLKKTEQYGRALADWDESRLILDNRAYYGYWRNIRLPSAGILPSSVDAAELYDLQGRSLAGDKETHHKPDKRMPPRIAPEQTGIALIREAGYDHIFHTFKIYRDASRSEIIGYGSIKVDFATELLTLHKFRYLRLDSIQLTAREGEQIPIPDFISRLRFEVEPNPETRALKSLIVRYLYGILTASALLMLLGHVLVASILTRPMRRLSQHIEGMRQGQNELLGDNYRGLLSVSELEHVRHSLNGYQAQLDEMHANLANKSEELWLLAHRDALTGTHNRRAFDDDWEQFCATGREAGDVAFLLFDCDHFKAINDSYGHQVGDRVLQGIVESLLSALRSGDRLYRLGGDEFATLLRGVDVEQTRVIAERCLERVHAFDFTPQGIQEPVRISIGICHSREIPDDGLHALHRYADLAMYHAKRPGQHKLAFYSPAMAESSDAVVSNSATTAVYEALRSPASIVLHYQPVVDLACGKANYCEALARIRDGDNLIMPGNIFPVVEARRLEMEFDLAVIGRIEHDLDIGLVAPDHGISINISGPGIIHDKVIGRLLELAARFPGRKLLVEVTETTLITQISHASANLGKLRQAGYLIALDDFGNGYSSLRYLASMPVDLVKFDITMIRSLDEGGRQSVFVEDLARMIKDAGYLLVAEGIETEHTLARVTELGFHYAQGFLLGRPIRKTIT